MGFVSLNLIIRPVATILSQGDQCTLYGSCLETQSAANTERGNLTLFSKIFQIDSGKTQRCCKTVKAMPLRLSHSIIFGHLMYEV